MTTKYRYEVLIFGSNRTRTDISGELSERGQSGWRVIAGGHEDNGSWSFILERAIESGAP
jgi:hypothetical protein